LPEDELKKRTTIFRADGVTIRDDAEVLQMVQNVHWERSFGGFEPYREAKF
jgi:methyl-coenzyme M reductase gamma subunit